MYVLGLKKNVVGLKRSVIGLKRSVMGFKRRPSEGPAGLTRPCQHYAFLKKSNWLVPKHCI